MRFLSHSLKLIFITGAMVACQLTSLSSPPAPRVPEVLATLNVDGIGSTGGYFATNARTGYVYITHAVRVTPIKGTEQLKTIFTNTDSTSRLAVDEVSNRIYAINLYNDYVSVIQDTQLITNIESVGSRLEDVVIEPRSRMVYAVSGFHKKTFTEMPIAEGNVMVISGTQVIGNVTVGPFHLTRVAVDPVGGYIYTGGFGGVVVTLKGLHEVARQKVNWIGNDPAVSPLIEEMDADARTGDMYVLSSDAQLTRFRAGKVTAEANFLKSDRTTIRNLRVHPLTGDVYLVDWRQSEVVVVHDMKEIARLPVGREPLKLAIDPLTGNVYVANAKDDTITVINGTNILSTIKVGWHPFGIGINPVNGWVYVANEGDGTVSVLGYRPPNYTPPAPTKLPTAPTVPTRTPTTKPYP
jgi:YVTN family beta-propeller protein